MEPRQMWIYLLSEMKSRHVKKSAHSVIPQVSVSQMAAVLISAQAKKHTEDRDNAVETQQQKDGLEGKT